MPRRSNLVRILLIALLVFVFLLMAVSPLLESLLPGNSSIGGWLEWARSRVMEMMVSLWFFAFGSMVGSFINVVVWRMPRGVSVVSSGSACPRCKNKIMLKDNIPIFGWIKLGGRCRVCRLPISPRYPIVEAIFGFVFLLLFFVELQSACGNLPGGKRYLSTGILQVVVSTKWDVILTFVYHIILIVMLLTWSLMAYDRSRIPVKTVVFTLLVGGGLAIAFPYVYPLQWHPGETEWFADLPWIQKSATPFLGLVCGFLLGSFFEGVYSGSPGDSNYSGNPANSQDSQANAGNGIGLTTSLMAIGLFTGWQATIWVTLLFGLGLGLRHYIPGTRKVPPCGVMAGAFIVFLCLWHWFHPEPKPANWPRTELAIATTVGLVLAWTTSRFRYENNPALAYDLGPYQREGYDEADGEDLGEFAQEETQNENQEDSGQEESL